MKIFYSCVFFLLVALFVAQPAISAQGSVAVRSSGETVMEILRPNLLIVSAIRIYQIEDNVTPAEASLLMKDCLDGRVPCGFVENIGIKVNKQELFVPRSVYRGLTNVRKAKLSIIRPNLFKLILIGGDASESYYVVIWFNKNRILERKLFSALAPKDAMEDTVFPPQKETFDK